MLVSYHGFKFVAKNTSNASKLVGTQLSKHKCVALPNIYSRKAI